MPKGDRSKASAASSSRRSTPYTRPGAAMPPHRTPSQAHAPTSPPPTGTHATTWKTEDDTQLMQARAQGLNWSPIARDYFPTKTPNACRKRHERLMEKQSQENWDGVKIEELAKAYVEVREEMWRVLAVKVGEKWGVVESKCMEKGVKTLLNVGRNASRKTKPKGEEDNEEGDSGLVLDPANEEDGEQDPQYPGGGSSGSSYTSGPPTSSAPAFSASTSSMNFVPAPVSAPQSQQTLPNFQTTFGMPSIASILQSASLTSY